MKNIGLVDILVEYYSQNERERGIIIYNSTMVNTYRSVEYIPGEVASMPVVSVDVLSDRVTVIHVADEIFGDSKEFRALETINRVFGKKARKC